MLERHKLISTRRERMTTRLYPTSLPKLPAPAPLTPAQTQVLEFIRWARPMQAEISTRLGISKQAANQHVKALERQRLIVPEERERVVCWVPAPTRSEQNPAS